MAIAVFRRTETPLTGRRPRVNWGHPLSLGLVAAFVSNPGGSGTGSGNNVNDVKQEVAYGDISVRWTKAAGVNNYGVFGYGPGWYTDGGFHSATAVPSRMQMQPPMSIFWLGSITANTASFGGYLAGVMYVASPFDCYGIYRVNDNTSIGFWTFSGGVNQGITVASQVSASDYDGNRFMSFGMTASPTLVAGYKNGRQVGTGTGVTAITYGTNPAMSINGSGAAFDITTPTVPSTWSVVYVWNRALSAAEHGLLGLNPFQLFTPATRRVSKFVAGVGGGTSYERILRGVSVGIGRGAR
jgi:hypothetical protein